MRHEERADETSIAPISISPPTTARLPAEQGAIVDKAIEAARDRLWIEHKNVSAETPSGFQAESWVKPGTQAIIQNSAVHAFFGKSDTQCH